MINVHFKKGDRVRVVKSCDADLPIGYETRVNDVLNYRAHVIPQRLSLFDRVGAERDRPGNEFELVERPTVVDRPTLVAREVLALWFETREKTGEVVGGNHNAQQVRSGEYDNRHDFRRARQYLVGVLTGYTDV